MIVTRKIEYRIQYQKDWKELGILLNKCNRMYKEFKDTHHKELKKKLVQATRELRNKCMKFYTKYYEYITESVLLEEVTRQIVKINSIDLRRTSTFSMIEDFANEVEKSKIVIS